LPELADSTPSFDRAVLDRLREALGDDAGVFAARLIQTFLRQGGELVLQLEQAARDGDVEAVTGLAHKLKGSSGSVGGQRLVVLCDELEHWQGSGATLGGKIAAVQEAVQALGLELASYS
jgi:HPt (histidine-containing phosphotransfer) domain-containing protein